MGWPDNVAHTELNSEDIAWMNSVIEQYPERHVWINLHEYMLTTGGLGPFPQRILDEVVAPNPNVFAVGSGHYHDAYTRYDEFDDDGDVTFACSARDEQDGRVDPDTRCGHPAGLSRQTSSEPGRMQLTELLEQSRGDSGGLGCGQRATHGKHRGESRTVDALRHHRGHPPARAVHTFDWRNGSIRQRVDPAPPDAGQRHQIGRTGLVATSYAEAGAGGCGVRQPTPD